MEIRQNKVELVLNSKEMASLIKAYETILEIQDIMWEQGYKTIFTNEFNINFGLLENTLNLLYALYALMERETLEVE